jgi:L-Ala-D/L-Glu epimerase / N-acetyl-D-glutamate racemase
VIIKSVDLEPVTLRKQDPNWRFALGASPITDGLIVRLMTDDGKMGEGFAASAAHMGAILGALKAELELFCPILIGKDPTRIESILGELDRAIRGAPQAKAGIDCALYDLQARALGVPLCQLLGGQVRGSVPILRILAIKTPKEMAAQAQKLTDKGYRYLKIKVHGEVEEDVARVAAVRRQVGEAVHLTIDANQSYTPKGAVSAIPLRPDLPHPNTAAR